MKHAPMLSFLGESSLRAHLEYLREERQRHSIEEKSIPQIKGCTPREIASMNIKRSIKEQILKRLVNIRLHECYFSSFTLNHAPCPMLKKYYSSENSFLYEAEQLALSADGGFLYIALDDRRVPQPRLSESNRFACIKDTPLLAVDLCEHAYFSDYSFDKKRYLRAALSHLDLSKLALDTKK